MGDKITNFLTEKKSNKERSLFHRPEKNLPKPHKLKRKNDNRYSVMFLKQGWLRRCPYCLSWRAADTADHRHHHRKTSRASPASPFREPKYKDPIQSTPRHCWSTRAQSSLRGTTPRPPRSVRPLLPSHWCCASMGTSPGIKGHKLTNQAT